MALTLLYTRLVHFECLHCAPLSPAPLEIVRRSGSDMDLVCPAVTQHVSPYSYFISLSFQLLLSQRAYYCKLSKPLPFAAHGYRSNVKKSEKQNHLFDIWMIFPEFHMKLRVFDIVMLVFYVYNCLIKLTGCMFNVRRCNFNCKVWWDKCFKISHSDTSTLRALHNIPISRKMTTFVWCSPPFKWMCSVYVATGLRSWKMNLLFSILALEQPETSFRVLKREQQDAVRSV